MIDRVDGYDCNLSVPEDGSMPAWRDTLESLRVISMCLVLVNVT